MRNLIIIIATLIALLPSLHIKAQESQPILETRYHNPIDTASILHGSTPTAILFTHWHTDNDHCPARKAQAALESDSLGIRQKYGIKLYVVFDRMTPVELHAFDSFNPINATFAYDYMNRFRRLFQKELDSPFLIFNDGEGNLFFKKGLDECLNFADDIESYIICEKCSGMGYIKLKHCPRCGGTGCVGPNRRSHNPDECVGICPVCGGSGIGFLKICTECNGEGFVKQ